MPYRPYVKLVMLPALLATLLCACKKDVMPDVKHTERSPAQQLKDSIYRYYTQYSLWSDTSTADQSAVEAFIDTYDAPQDLLNALKSMTPNYPAYNGPIDRFSYLESSGSDGLMANAAQAATPGFGLYLSIAAVSNNKAYPIVYFVEGGSAAEKAGIRRSDAIIALDGQDFGIPINCNSGACNVIDPALQQQVVNSLLSALERNTLRVTLRHSDDAESTMTITAQPYDVNPISSKRIFSYPGQHIGYLALSSFEDLTAGQPNRFRLDAVFSEFENNQINDLILDLRYNTGGYISAAEYVANRVIPAAADGKLMYKYALNAYMSQRKNWKGESFDDVYYKRNGNLNLKTVYFLVTDITASAAELLINVLRPYMRVVIIAENDGTYGKPVGFFKQEIMGKTALWAASFKLINSRGETDYWDGIQADQRKVVDYIFRDFGDPEETMIAAAITHATGTGTLQPRKTMGTLRQLKQVRKTRITQVNAIPQSNMFR
jgi:carboxyl-terminal processing protease